MCGTELYSECASSIECNSVLLADSDDGATMLTTISWLADHTRMGYAPYLATASIMAM
jgi:hypothetical protein